MVDSTCVMQSFVTSSSQQGDSSRVLGESVSFGKYKNQTLEWSKFSAFNQNRYLEEAQSLAKPGLVAQRKALFEAHFKKPVDEKVTVGLKAKNEVRVLKNDNKENIVGEPCNDMGSVKARCGLFINAVMGSKDTSLRVDYPRSAALIESGAGQAYHCVNNDAVAVNSSSPVILVLTDGPASEMAVDASECLEECHNQNSPCDTRNINHMMAKEKSAGQNDSIYHSEAKLNKSKVVDLSTRPMGITRDKIAVQEPFDKFVLASSVNSEPEVTLQNTPKSVKNSVVRPHCSLRSQALLMKEIDAPVHENSKASGVGLLNRTRVFTKQIQVPMNQETQILVQRKSLAGKKFQTSFFSDIHSKEHSEQVTAPDASSSNRKSSTYLHLRSAPLKLKKEMTATRTDKTFMRKSFVQKATSKLETPTLWRKTGTESAASKTFSTNVPGIQVLSHTTNMGKQMMSSTNKPIFGRKSTVQLHGKSLDKTGCSVIQNNSALTLSKSNLRKPLQKAPHISFGSGSMVHKCGSPKIATFNVRASKESSNHMQKSFQKPMQTLATRRFDEKGCKRPDTKIDCSMIGTKKTKSCPRSSVNLNRPPPTVSIPFRFRSDERAAKRKQKFEDNSNVEAENPMQSKPKARAILKAELHRA